jgi:hypothetical protein
MRSLKTGLLTLILSVALAAQIDTNSQHYYVFVYFVQGEVEQSLGARLAFSTDAVNWEKYSDEKPVIVPKVAKGESPLMRDPNILYDPNTGVFHLTWTTGWNQDNVGYSSSADLINWSEQVMIPVGQKIDGCHCCWAPEFFYDDIKDSVMLYWSTDRGIHGKEAFYSMTKDFKNYTIPKTCFSPKDEDGNVYSIIDENLLKVADKKYYLFFKDERKAADAGKVCQNIHFVFGPTPQGPWWKGPWDDVSNPISTPGTEGPTSIIMGDEVRVYFDPYMNHSSTDRSRVIKLANLIGDSAPQISSFTPGPVMKTASGNFLPSNGTILEVPRAKVMQALYGIKDNTNYPKSWTPSAQQNISFIGDVGVLHKSEMKMKQQVSFTTLSGNRILIQHSFTKQTPVDLSLYSVDGKRFVPMFKTVLGPDAKSLVWAPSVSVNGAKTVIISLNANGKTISQCVSFQGE